MILQLESSILIGLNHVLKDNVITVGSSILIGLTHVIWDNDITIGELSLERAEPCDRG